MKLSRRFLLRGLGATVALPVLPSLLTARDVQAQASLVEPCFVSFNTHHGGIWANNMFPVPTAGIETQNFAGRTIRRAPLTAVRSGGRARLSPVLTASDAALTPSLLSKMFSLQGLDVPFYLAHNSGGALGNYAANAGTLGVGDDGLAKQNARRRTVDQVMGWSTSFYPNLDGVRQRVLVGTNDISFNYANPATKTGAIEAIAGTDTPNHMFDTLFPSGGGNGPRAPIVDKVIESYRRLRSNPRLSKADVDRLDDHLQRLSETQRRLDTPVTCTDVARPSNPMMTRSLGDVKSNEASALNPTAHAQYYQAINDIIVLAFSCGGTRVAVNRIDLTFSNAAVEVSYGYWHDSVAHQANQTDGVQQTVLYQAHQRIFENVILDLARKLEAVETPTGTLLDRTLVAWSQESGNTVHDSNSVPVIGFGGAANFLRTGFHVDFRNTSMPLTANAERRYPGLLWNQWLGTVLQAMRVPREEWERPAVCGGYPDYRYQNLEYASVNASQAWPESVWNSTSQVLPWLGV